MTCGSKRWRVSAGCAERANRPLDETDRDLRAEEEITIRGNGKTRASRGRSHLMTIGVGVAASACATKSEICLQFLSGGVSRSLRGRSNDHDLHACLELCRPRCPQSGRRPSSSPRGTLGRNGLTRRWTRAGLGRLARFLFSRPRLTQTLGGD